LILINGTPGFSCLGAYADAETALDDIPATPPKVVLMDVNLPKTSGIECVQRLKSSCPDLNILMLTVHEDDETIFEALQAGADGYLLKRTPSAEILQAIADVRNGAAPMSSSIARKVIQSFHSAKVDFPRGSNLTEREAEILKYLAKGYLYKEIAEHFELSYETVHSHIRNIYHKLHVRSRTEAVTKYLKKKR
jgi:DNA-binding NarL/FixJ family response regulator